MSERGPKQSVLLPVLLPVAILVVIGAVLIGFSRVLLGMTATAAWVTALIAAAGVMVVASISASRKEVGNATLLATVGGAAGIAMLAGGLALFVAERGEHGPEGPELPVVRILAEVGAATDGYATTTVSAPVDEPFLLEFDNQDDTAPHNVVIATADPQEDAQAEILFEREAFLGPRVAEWEIEPLAEGDYFFFCSVHPTTMTGTLTTQALGNVVVAQDLLFDTEEITLPADTPTQVVMDNRDVGIPHNVSIYTDDTLSDPIVKEDPTPGPATVTYEVPALEVGTYFFHCDVHPTTMFGTVTVDGGGGGGGGDGGGEAATGATGATGGTGATGATGATGGG